MDIRMQLIEELESLAAQHGLELVNIELVGSKKAPTIRIFLDAEGGISFEQILEAHSWIDPYMDERDPFPGAYVMEVSSPGIDRPLRKLEDFSRFAGEQVIISSSPIEGRGKWSGKLQGVEGSDVLITLEDGQAKIPFAAIKKANVKGQIEFK